MGNTGKLLWPALCAARNRIRRYPRVAGGILVAGGLMLLGLEQLTEAFLRRLLEVPIGQILAHHLMSMFLFSLQFLLAFSALINALSAYFLSRDLDTVLVSPVPIGALFWAKGVETLVTAAWMVQALLVPVLFAYGNVLAAPASFYPIALMLPIPFLTVACAVGVSLALVVARVLPVRRTRDLMRFFGVAGIAVLVVIFRVMQPERLVEPGNFEKMAAYLVSLHPPGLKLFPSYWLTEVAYGFLRADYGFLFPRFLAFTLGGALIALAVARLLFAVAYRPALQKFLEAPPPPPRRPGWLSRTLTAPLRFLPAGLGAVLTKDARVMARSPVIWTQICLMGVIVVIYGYNLYLVPVATLETLHRGLTLEITFLNGAFMGFLLVAAALRFGFPSISLEGEGFLIVHVSPLGMRRFLLGKLLLNAGPLVVLAGLLGYLADRLLSPPPALLAVSYATALVIAVTTGFLALDFGAHFRNLRATNPSHLPSGPGGVAFLVVAMTVVFAIVGLQAYPFWLYRKVVLFGFSPDPWSWRLGTLLLTLSLTLPLLLSSWSYRRTLRSLEGGLE